MLFSAGASHPDAIATLSRLATARFRPAALVTLRDPIDLLDLRARLRSPPLPLSSRRLIPKSEDGPVERKLVALAAGGVGGTIRGVYEDAFREWSKQLQECEFGGLVLDYDGTVCSTGRRFELPSESMRTRLLRLLAAGVVIGIATGRGKSVHHDLRQWVPEARWPQVLLGLYNGGVALRLDDAIPDLREPSALMVEVVERIATLPLAPALHLEGRSAQVTIGTRPDAFAHIGRLAEIVVDALGRHPGLPVKVVASGHSVDVVPADTTKVVIAEASEAAAGAPVLAIGDQGDLGGNDFELLASSPWTLTVDRCSADPSRCLYLDSSGRTGPELLEVISMLSSPPTGASVSMRSGSIRWPLMRLEPSSWNRRGCAGVRVRGFRGLTAARRPRRRGEVIAGPQLEDVEGVVPARESVLPPPGTEVRVEAAEDRRVVRR